MKKYYLMVLMLLCIGIAHAQLTFSRDTTFGTLGSLDFSALTGQQYGQILRIICSDDGNFYILTKISDQEDPTFNAEGILYEGNSNWLLKTDRNGNPETSFAENGILRLPDFYGTPDIQLTDGGFLVFFPYSLRNTAQNLPGQQYQLLKYHTDGTPDTSYGNQGVISEKVYYPEFSGLQRFPVNAFLYHDGTAVVEKYMPDDSLENSSVAVRFTKEGKQDMAFGTGGILYGLCEDFSNTSFVRYQNDGVISREDYLDGIHLSLRRYDGDYSPSLSTASPEFSSGWCADNLPAGQISQQLYVSGDESHIMLVYQASLFQDDGSLLCRTPQRLLAFDSALNIVRDFGSNGFADITAGGNFRGVVPYGADFLVYGNEGIAAFDASGQPLKINGENLLDTDADELMVTGNTVFLRKGDTITRYSISGRPLEVQETPDLDFKTLNPFDSTIRIFPSEGFSHAELYDFSGKFLLRSTQTEIAVPQLGNGVYLLRITAVDGKVFTKKIVK